MKRLRQYLRHRRRERLPHDLTEEQVKQALRPKRKYTMVGDITYYDGRKKMDGRTLG